MRIKQANCEIEDTVVDIELFRSATCWICHSTQILRRLDWYHDLEGIILCTM